MFSDYTAQFQHVTESLNLPQLICVYSKQNADNTRSSQLSEFPLFETEMCGRLQCLSRPLAFAGSTRPQVSWSLTGSQAQEKDRSSVCWGGLPTLLPPQCFFPLFWSQSETVILAAFSISMNWSKPRFHFVPWMAFLQSTTSVSSLLAFTPERI